VVKKPIPRAYVIVGLTILAWLVVIGLVILGLEILHLMAPSSVVMPH